MTTRSFISTTGTGIARLTEGAASSTEHLRGESVSSLATGPVGTQVVLAGTEGNGIFTSTGRGVSWTSSPLDYALSVGVVFPPATLRAVSTQLWSGNTAGRTR